MIKVIQLLKELSKTPQRTQCYFEKLAYFENPVVKTTHLGKKYIWHKKSELRVWNLVPAAIDKLSNLDQVALSSWVLVASAIKGS